MNRIWAGLPIAVIAAVPLWTGASAPVYGIELVAILICACGVLAYSLSTVSAGAGLAIIGYTVALWLSGDGVAVIGAAAFGLALLSLLAFSEFARQFRGAAVARSVIRGQIIYWIGRAALAFGAIILLILMASGLAALVPAAGRAVIGGLGAVIAFAGALYAAMRRTES